MVRLENSSTTQETFIIFKGTGFNRILRGRLVAPGRHELAIRDLTNLISSSWQLHSTADLQAALPDGWKVVRTPDYDSVGRGRIRLSERHLGSATLSVEVDGRQALRFDQVNGVHMTKDFEASAGLFCDVVGDAVREARLTAAARGLERSSPFAKEVRQDREMGMTPGFA